MKAKSFTRRFQTSTAPALLGVVSCAALSWSCRRGPPAAPSPAARDSAAPRRPGLLAAAEPPSPETSLRKVIDLEVKRATLWHLGGGAILLHGGRNFFAHLEGDAVQVLPELGRGLRQLQPKDGADERGFVHRITGRWPDGVWLVWRGYDTWSAADNLRYERLFRYRLDHWERVHETTHDQSANTLYRGLWEQPEGCLVGLLSDDREAGDAKLARTTVLDCPDQPAPQLSFKATTQDDYGIAATLGFASGHVLVLEQSTKSEGAPTPARFSLSQPGAPNRTEIELPLPPEVARASRRFRLRDCKLFGASPSEMYVVGNYDLGAVTVPLLLRFDGTSFTPLPAPPVGYIGDADLAEDGSLVLLGSPPKAAPRVRSTWVLPRGGAWQERPMPVDPKVSEPYRPWSIAARSRDDVWVVGYHENEERKNRRLALFHSHRPDSAARGAGAASP